MSWFSAGHMTPAGAGNEFKTQVQKPIFWSGPWDGDRFQQSGTIVSTARDTGNTNNTTTLRPGLLLARTSDSDRIFQVYDPTATDGIANVVAGILLYETGILDAAHQAADRYIQYARQGFIDPTRLIGFTPAVRTQLSRLGFTLVDSIGTYDASIPRVRIVKAESYTVTAADHGAIFATTGATGAVTFTLPALADGLTYWFSNEANQNMVISRAGSDTIVTLNDLSATSVSASTTDEKIGVKLKVVAEGGKWHVYDYTVRL